MSSNDHDVYRRVGRGGAGNYVASTKADDAARDLEAQELDTVVVPPPDPSTTHVPTRAGRGGAGNYVDPANLPNAREQEEMADWTAAAISKRLRRPSRGGATGRGGAGNWKWDDEELKKAAEEEEKAKANELEQKAKNSVDEGLKQPEKVHHIVHHSHKHSSS